MELEKLIQRLHTGDTLIITKLDRISNSVQQGIRFVNDLVQQGIRVHVINVGIIDHSPTGRLI